jgi:hypothetical protein
MSDPSDIYFKYLQLKKDGEKYEVISTPYCERCDTVNPDIILGGKNKNIELCAKCKMPISYKITKKLIRSKELLDFINSLPKYKKEGDRFTFEDGIVVELREVGKGRWGYEDVTYQEYYCTKCNKWSYGCIHFIAIEEGRTM